MMRHYVKNTARDVPASPDADRQNFDNIYHIGRVGAWAMQHDIKLQRNDRRRVALDGLADAINRAKARQLDRQR